MVNKQRVAMLAIIGGALIFTLKLVAFQVTDSVALLSDAMESIINIVASIMMFISIRIADIPEDSNHHYGHRKAENLSAFVEGFLILIAGFLIIDASVDRVFSPVGLRDVNIGLLISLLATSLNAMLSYILLREARRSGSIAMEGDSKHLFSDVLSSIGVVIGLFIASLTGLAILDPLLAMMVAVIIIKMGIDIIRKASSDLMDQNCPEAEAKIAEVMSGIDGFIEYHDLKTRKVADRCFAEFHLCVNGDRSVRESHALTDQIETEIKKQVPGIMLNIHVETEDECCTMKASAEAKAAGVAREPAP